MGAMNMTTIILVNGIFAAGLLAVLAAVMAMGHRVASSKSSGAHWARPLPAELVQSDPEQPVLERAA
jgi:hypothetical protein